MRKKVFVSSGGVLTCQPGAAFGSDDCIEAIGGKQYCTHISCILYSRRVTSSHASSSSQCFVWSHACRSGRDAGLAGSIGALVRVLLHRGETTWQQRRDVVAKRRPRRAPERASGARQPVAHRRARARARVQGKRQPVAQLASGGSSLRAKPNGKAGDIAGFFAFSDITASNARSPAARSSRSVRDTPFRLSAPRARTRSSLPGSSLDWPRSRRPPLQP
jgi:hypothetical protein